jgi:hypothetical protein
MKQTIRWILVSLVACAIGSLVTYRTAYHRGYESGYKNGVVSAIGHTNFGQSVAFFAALQTLRAGDIPGATRFMEKACFSSAHIFYKYPTPSAEDVSDWGRAQGWDRSPDAATAKAFAGELVKYRAAYRTNRAEWDAMEQKLEVELARLKSVASGQ